MLSVLIAARVVDFIESCLASDLSVRMLAGVAGLSPYHFNRMFREITGLPLHRFVMDRRIKRAAALLRETAAPIADVALAAGFYDQSHLTGVFKRRMGVSPGFYRALR